MNKKLVMYGLKGPDGDLVKLNLAFRSFALFETREDALQDIELHNSGFEPVEVELNF